MGFSVGIEVVVDLARTPGGTSGDGQDGQLEVNTLAGVDSVDSSGLVAGVIQVLVDGVPD